MDYDQKAILEKVLAELIYQKKVSSQVDFAGKLNKNESYFSQIMNGRQRLSPKLADEMKRVFGLSKEYLLTGRGDMFEGGARENKNEDLGLIELLRSEKSKSDMLIELQKEIIDNQKEKMRQLEEKIEQLQKDKSKTVGSVSKTHT